MESGSETGGQRCFQGDDVSDHRDFDAKLREKAEAIAEDFSSDSGVLLVALGGFAGGMGIPPFEFFKITSDLDTNRVFIRDLPQAMYHMGLPGVGGGVDGIVGSIRRRIEENGIDRVVVVGNSGGGYASLLVGALLDADEVIAFSPVTFIGPVARFVHRDRRAPRLFFRAWISPDRRSDYFDLKEVLKKHGTGSTFRIYYCHTGDMGRLDTLHATRMKDFPNVRLCRLDSGGHNLVKLLRDDGKLDGILRRAISGNG
jgi:pimeloyl-ACP methyl ester carboxylesterase